VFVYTSEIVGRSPLEVECQPVCLGRATRKTKGYDKGDVVTDVVRDPDPCRDEEKAVEAGGQATIK
jgi:hypothetical protein